MDFLEFSDITAEIKGCMTPGKLKMTDHNLIFKNSKTGRVEQFSASEMEVVNFQNFVDSCGLRIFLKSGSLHRFAGFKESEKDKIAKFFSSIYKINALELELSLKGWNWGTAKFMGSVLNFEVGDKPAFEIPLNYVSQCIPGKNEVTMEFHQNDDAPVSLMEMRFFIPSSESTDVDPVDAFQQQVMQKANVINVSGDAIAIFREIQCLTPRGRYDIKIFQTFFQLHGKTFDYKIPMSTVLRLFLLPHKDSRQMFFVISLDPPIKQGQTRYHFLVLLFGQEEEASIELPFTESEIKEKYENKLEKEMSGPTYEVLGKLMKVIINRKLTGPGSFLSHSQTPSVGCSFKAAAGYLYPLERGFIYVHKPPLHIRFEEILTVNFARGGGNTRSFDFEVELKSGTVHTFSSIEKEEYAKLYDFINSKKLHIKNRGKNDKANYKDDFGDSDNEKVPDAYLERVKAEAQEREEDSNDEDESTDEDFNPEQVESDVAEEFDSNPSTSEDSEAGSGDEAKKKPKKSKTAKTISEKPRKQRQKKDKDSNKPKRPQTAFMLWLNDSRKKIQSDNPGIKVTEIAKKGGEMWKELKDKSEWDKKAVKAKQDYEQAMKEYLASGGGAETSSSSKKEKTRKTPSKPAASGGSKSAKREKPKKASSEATESVGNFKSKEFISDDDESTDEEENKKASKDTKRKREDSPEKKKSKSKKSESEAGSSSEEDKKKSKKIKKKPASDAGSSSEEDKKKSKKSKKKAESEDDDEEEEILSTPTASEDSDSGSD